MVDISADVVDVVTRLVHEDAAVAAARRLPDRLPELWAASGEFDRAMSAAARLEPATTAPYTDIARHLAPSRPIDAAAVLRDRHSTLPAEGVCDALTVLVGVAPDLALAHVVALPPNHRWLFAEAIAPVLPGRLDEVLDGVTGEGETSIRLAAAEALVGDLPALAAVIGDLDALISRTPDRPRVRRALRLARLAEAAGLPEASRLRAAALALPVRPGDGGTILALALARTDLDAALTEVENVNEFDRYDVYLSLLDDVARRDVRSAEQVIDRMPARERLPALVRLAGTTSDASDRRRIVARAADLIAERPASLGGAAHGLDGLVAIDLDAARDLRRRLLRAAGPTSSRWYAPVASGTARSFAVVDPDGSHDLALSVEGRFRSRVVASVLALAAPGRPRWAHDRALAAPRTDTAILAAEVGLALASSRPDLARDLAEAAEARPIAYLVAPEESRRRADVYRCVAFDDPGSASVLRDAVAWTAAVPAAHERRRAAIRLVADRVPTAQEPPGVTIDRFARIAGGDPDPVSAWAGVARELTRVAGSVRRRAAARGVVVETSLDDVMGLVAERALAAASDSTRGSRRDAALAELARMWADGRPDDAREALRLIDDARVRAAIEGVDRNDPDEAGVSDGERIGRLLRRAATADDPAPLLDAAARLARGVGDGYRLASIAEAYVEVDADRAVGLAVEAASMDLRYGRSTVIAVLAACRPEAAMAILDAHDSAPSAPPPEVDPASIGLDVVDRGDANE